MSTAQDQRRPIKAVIFDMDGLLLDSERLYTKVTDEILAPYNKQLTWEIKSQVMGRPALEAAAILIEKTGIPMTPNELVAAMFSRQQVLFPSVQPMPGAIKLVKHLHKHQIPIAIATGSIRGNFERKIENLSELFSPFDGRVVCGDDPALKRGKPDPDPYLLAGSRYLGLNVSPDPSTGFYEPPQADNNAGPDVLRTDEILVFEDGIAGVRSGKAAGMRVIWVPDPELKRLPVAEHDAERLADQVLGSLEEWNGSEWGLPSFQ